MRNQRTAGKASQPKYIKGNFKIHGELVRLIDGDTDLCQAPNTYLSRLNGQRVTVVITFPKTIERELEDLHPGHVGIALWNNTNYTFTTRGINAKGGIDHELFTHGDLTSDTGFEAWYFTKSVSNLVASDMLTRMQALGNSKTYRAFFPTGSIDDSYNCVSVVDSILWAGGLSKGIASIFSTPYMYSSTFGDTWTQTRIDGQKNVF